MSKNLSVRVNSRTVKGSQYFEGIVSIPGLQPTKLVKSTGDSAFSTKSALFASARSVAKRAGYTGIVEAIKPTTKKPKKATV